MNKRSAVHAGSAGQSTAFPDVNLCPPTPPAGPIPTPLPNLAMAADLQGGATSVLIEGNPMGKKTSFFAKSTGNEVAQSTGGGVVSHIVQGKAYFTSYSFDVTVEGEEAPRHLDMMTHNHLAQSPPNSAMGTHLAMMDAGAMPPAEDAPEEHTDPFFEVFVDQLQGQPAGGLESAQLTSDDGAYDQTLPLAAAAAKGGLLALKFEKLLPGKFYSLYWIVAGEKIPFWEHVAFSQLREHAPGTERAPLEPPVQDEEEASAAEDDGSGAADPPPETPDDHPDEWYELPTFPRQK